jgi:HPt (histidine-containing phosphotransfer) domain-containing protein
MHALKSASENIGAADVSGMAKMLEIAGRQINTEYINAWNGVLIKSLDDLLCGIKKALAVHDPFFQNNFQNNISSASRGELAEGLNALKDALGEMDAGVINKTVGSLERLSPSDSVLSVLKSISNNILLAEYDEALELIDSLLSEIAAS